MKRHPYHSALRKYPYAAILTHSLAAVLTAAAYYFLRHQ